jgi:hypothetical protein
MNGSVTKWNDATGKGLIRESNATHAFDKSDCSTRLQNRLKDKAIPEADPPVQVTFDVDLNAEAINVDLV